MEDNGFVLISKEEAEQDWILVNKEEVENESKCITKQPTSSMFSTNPQQPIAFVDNYVQKFFTDQKEKLDKIENEQHRVKYSQELRIEGRLYVRGLGNHFVQTFDEQPQGPRHPFFQKKGKED